ncbi:uncharacterized protein LOC9655956 [Selaginella moellendorffii]|uniref:uncharacterized protein LOC9655956 n=1 Tax=Selaginella moellendorffii TaxID=88036 RepID=UPI000D1CF213|nr:uncharacterized protein LOC9655956 [Selaginella moellendorffii]|eukprot:XP_024534824.1 uncharacterized protein LOC9655956 [Selaginella moellendorffii]
MSYKTRCRPFAGAQCGYEELQMRKQKEYRVLIVGASGFLGSQLALGLEAHKHPNLRFLVTGLDVERSERTLLLESKGIEVVYGSATDPELAMAVIRSKKPNIVVDFTQQEHSWNLEDNERTMKSLLDAACSVPSMQCFFFASPNRFYIPSSRSAEKLVESLAPKLPFPVVEWRFSTVYGSYGRPDFPYYKFVDQILHKTDVPLWEQRKGRQNYIYIDDAVTVMINSILSSHSMGQVNLYDIGTPWPPIPFKGVIKVVETLTNLKAWIVEIEDENPGPYEIAYEPPTNLLLLKSYISFEKGIKVMQRHANGDQFVHFRELGACIHANTNWGMADTSPPTDDSIDVEPSPKPLRRLTQNREAANKCWLTRKSSSLISRDTFSEQPIQQCSGVVI